MLILSSTTQSLEIKLSWAITTNQADWTAHYGDDAGGTLTEWSSLWATNSTTDVTMVAAPWASTKRMIKNLTVYNADTATITFTISLNDNWTKRVILKKQLWAGTQWIYDSTAANGSWDVVWPSSATNEHIAVFDWTTGKLLKDWGATVDSLVPKSTYDAHTILAATTDNTPAALTVWEQTVVGRATGWNIAALAIDSDLSSVSANNDTIPSAKATKAYADLMLPLTWGTMTGNIQLWENTSLDNNPSLSADGKYTGIAITWTAWATLAFWDLIYLDPTDSRRELADANIAAWSDWDARWILWICVLAASWDWQPTKILLHWVVRADTAFPSLTINAQAYVSETAWDITNTAPTTSWAIVRVVWWWLTADALYFNPSSDWAEV